jgi:hypothetical protein
VRRVMRRWPLVELKKHPRGVRIEPQVRSREIHIVTQTSEFAGGGGGGGVTLFIPVTESCRRVSPAISVGVARCSVVWRRQRVAAVG